MTAPAGGGEAGGAGVTAPAGGGGRRRRGGGEAAMVPDAEVRTYYDRPILKAPVWKWPVPAYFFTGGLAGASATLALGARLAGHHALARRALVGGALGAAASPALLVADLGKPERFLHMLRVAKPTSPMSVGTWVISAFAPAVLGAAACDLTGLAPGAGRALEVVAGALGPVMCTYTAVLVADTAVPAWHGARRELPFVFAGSAAASAGAAAVALSPPAAAGPARRLMAAGVLVEGTASQVMERAHPESSRPYTAGGRAHALASWAKGLSVGGTALVLSLGRRRRLAAVAGATMVLAGAVCERFCVAAAGVESARDPAATIGPQRRRAAASVVSTK
ncbi:MAG: NrfD/PsrC family molybdoenzyme membrane anchor subunit [Acidimicrobiales bacterium]